MIIRLSRTTTAEVQRRMLEIRDEGGVVALGRVLTLVVHTQIGAEEEAIRAANAASREHPMRVIVVSRNPDRVSAKEEPRLDAELRVGADAGASEVVLLQCYGELGSHLLGIVQGLLLPDAPVVAWWPSFMPDRPSGAQLGQIAQRRITDSGKQKDPRGAILSLAACYAPGDTDLAWTRLTNWRGHLAALLDQPPYEAVRSGLVSGDLSNPSVHLMAAWLELRLGIEVEKVEAGDTPVGSSGLHAVELHRETGDSSLTRVRDSVGVLEQPGQPSHHVALSTRGLEDQLAEELRKLDADDMYRQVLVSTLEGR
ncbi:glucose-6-phosphate dehydrogenase assembly protein OpcA [Agrococcus jenensis]|uniref:Glucose-6-phosphate dehydrogenase assembly protein OpcA n=1 Tax=Agrococcus jenensis TaxID=46353 RepID=A0A3N2AVF6_9MICO|nr:glucose-6-phosphate dehydrogenase assembly protein OpcA [Agrococcus jenensis]ROR67006.1 glucose-6-phosphate dehydrogenase assembly protein OpcA [Agrococcus jenensis]